eukprot:1157527-Pelagomonas_calceolata.AAC.1
MCIVATDLLPLALQRSSQNTQPALLPWTVLGQMNNCEYRLVLHPYKDNKGGLGVRFQHPAPIKVGKLGHVGWREEEHLRTQLAARVSHACCVCVREREREDGGGQVARLPTSNQALEAASLHSGGKCHALPTHTHTQHTHTQAAILIYLLLLDGLALEAAGIATKEGPLPPIKELAAAPKAAAAAPKPPPGSAKEFTMEEVAEHTSPESAWFVHEGKVYNATPFLEDHPGGPDSILIATGADATEDFNAIHSKKVGQTSSPDVLKMSDFNGRGAVHFNLLKQVSHCSLSDSYNLPTVVIPHSALREHTHTHASGKKYAEGLLHWGA